VLAGTLAGGYLTRLFGIPTTERPLRTYLTSFRAAIGLYFFKLAFE